MSKELGTLIIVVLKARNLNDKHSFYKQDVFAQVTFNGVTKRTPVDVKGGQHPVWDAELRFPVMKEASEKHRTLEVSCWAKEPRTDDILGQGKVDISDTLKTGEFDDWVSLETAGVIRGDLYLEMTYYASAPAPATLAVPSTSGLNRRPSKFSPSDRLSRPSQPYPISTSPSHSASPHPSPNHGQHPYPYPQTPTSPNGTHLLPHSSSSSRSSSASSKGRDTALPSLPENSSQPLSIPTTLLSGAGLKPKTNLQPQQPQLQPQPQQVPSILRPGNSVSSTVLVSHPPPSGHPAHARYPSCSPTPQYSVPTDPIRGYSPAPAPAPSEYKTTSPHPQINTGYSSISIPVYSPPPPPASTAADIWGAAPSVPVSFPVPVASPIRETFNYHSGYRGPTQPPSQAQPQSQMQPPYRRASDLPDPYLIARYQTPLPLPPGSTAPPRSQQTLPQQHTPSPADAARVQALRAAEEDAARRKAQEEKDLELARQLDRELNL